MLEQAQMREWTPMLEAILACLKHFSEEPWEDYVLKGINEEMINKLVTSPETVAIGGFISKTKLMMQSLKCFSATENFTYISGSSVVEGTFAAIEKRSGI
ncbi:hypothetical protein N9L19_01395 [bacterium]|nr:hypothetical protein [bacterium]